MKGRLFLIFFAALAIPMGSQTGYGQAIKSQHAIGSGEGRGSRSVPYIARTPYTLRWTAESKTRNNGTQATTVKAADAWTSVMVLDADTGNIICNSPQVGLSGELKVPAAGKHMITVSAPGKWTADLTEDAAMLKAAADRGELKPGVLLDEARRTSLRTKNEAVEERKALVLWNIRESRESIGDEAVRLLSEDATKAAQLASSAEDFDRRFKVMSDETLKKLAPPKPEPQPKKPVPSSNWNGKGLPPGMQIRK